ncbi:hypothetical protein EVAR_11623_1 [Eumeta japonica]|uniref:Uncharacterized protein n=1 Tax=Eumeta variegata TaxID=151549 RepID=A0A4C1WU83_EUMVA|nr:hypothetical protein EVAR_11623_1 [Eumeta japonica]
MSEHPVRLLNSWKEEFSDVTHIFLVFATPPGSSLLSSFIVRQWEPVTVHCRLFGESGASGEFFCMLERSCRRDRLEALSTKFPLDCKETVQDVRVQFLGTLEPDFGKVRRKKQPREDQRGTEGDRTLSPACCKSDTTLHLLPYSVKHLPCAESFGSYNATYNTPKTCNTSLFVSGVKKGQLVIETDTQGSSNPESQRALHSTGKSIRLSRSFVRGVAQSEAKLNASALARGVLLGGDVQNEVIRIKRERRRPGDQHVGLKSEGSGFESRMLLNTRCAFNLD